MITLAILYDKGEFLYIRPANHLQETNMKYPYLQHFTLNEHHFIQHPVGNLFGGHATQSFWRPQSRLTDQFGK